eukprot:3912862-Rhodomonas_salina.2
MTPAPSSALSAAVQVDLIIRACHTCLQSAQGDVSAHCIRKIFPHQRLCVEGVHQLNCWAVGFEAPKSVQVITTADYRKVSDICGEISCCEREVEPLSCDKVEKVKVVVRNPADYVHPPVANLSIRLFHDWCRVKLIGLAPCWNLHSIRTAYQAHQDHGHPEDGVEVAQTTNTPSKIVLHAF